MKQIIERIGCGDEVCPCEEVEIDTSAGFVELTLNSGPSDITIELDRAETRELADALMRAAASLNWRGETE